MDKCPQNSCQRIQMVWPPTLKVAEIPGIYTFAFLDSDPKLNNKEKD